MISKLSLAFQRTLNEARTLHKSCKKYAHSSSRFDVLNPNAKGQVPIKAWVKGVEVEPDAKEQLENIAKFLQV